MQPAALPARLVWPGSRTLALAAGALRGLFLLAEVILAAALLGELGVVVLDVTARTLGGSGFLWTQEVAQFALSVITFLGGAVAYRCGHHTQVRLVLDRLSERACGRMLVLAETGVLLAAIVAGCAAIPAILDGWSELTPILGLPAALDLVPLLAGAVLLGLASIERLAQRGPAAMAAAVALAAAAVVAMVATGTSWSDWLSPDTALGLALALLPVGLFCGVPVAFVLVLTASGYLWTSAAGPIEALAQNMVNGTSNFVLLAVPFFIFAGLVMERGGISLRLVRFVGTLVGHFRGGLLQVMVGSMYLVSGLSGSKAADVAAVGSVMREMLDAEGIPAAEGAAVLAASAAMGETVPPSIAMLVLGSITSLSVAGLFIGGLLPAAVIALCLMLLIWLRARRGGQARARWVGPRAALRAGLGAVLPLGMPALLFGGIMAGLATPTEISAFAVLYGVALALFVLREMSWRSLLATAVDTAVMTGMILFILAAAAGLSWALTIAFLPQRLVALLQGAHASGSVFLLGSIVLLIVVGSLLEGLPALNVLAPLLLPIAAQIGLGPLHYGIVLVIAMGVGAFLPPAGVGFYVCCAVMQTPVGATARAMLPYVAVLLLGLLIVAFVPWLTNVLPHAFGFG